MTEYQKDFLGDENTEVYEAYVKKFQELAVVPVSSFVSDLNNLPALEEITSEYTANIYAVMSQYENFSSYQKALVGEESLEKYNQYVDKYKELTGETGEDAE